jgi:hypothetical protein
MRATASDYLAALLPPPAGTAHPSASAAGHPGFAAPAPDGTPSPRSSLRPGGAAPGGTPAPSAVPGGRPAGSAGERTAAAAGFGIPEGAEAAFLRAETGRGGAIPDLRPAALVLTDGERAVIPLVGPLLPTPRAGKKMINLYRLVRIGVPDGELGAFTAGPCQAVLLLLAVVIGHPALACPLLTALDAASADDEGGGDDGGGSGEIVEFLRGKPCGEALQPACDTVADTVEANRRAGTPFHGPLATYRHWAPRIARHSFHTVGLLPPAGVGTADADRRTAPADLE